MYSLECTQCVKYRLVSDRHSADGFASNARTDEADEREETEEDLEKIKVEGNSLAVYNRR